MVKKLSANAGDIRDTALIPGSGRSPEEGMATHSSILEGFSERKAADGLEPLGKAF